MIIFKVPFWSHVDWSAFFVYLGWWWDLQNEDSGVAHSFSPNWMLDLKSYALEAILPLDKILQGPWEAPLAGPIVFLELTQNSFLTGKKNYKNMSLPVSLTSLHSDVWWVVQSLAKRLVNSVKWCLMTKRWYVQVRSSPKLSDQLGSQAWVSEGARVSSTHSYWTVQTPRTREHTSSFVLWATFWPKWLHFSTLMVFLN